VRSFINGAAQGVDGATVRSESLAGKRCEPSGTSPLGNETTEANQSTSPLQSELADIVEWVCPGFSVRQDQDPEHVDEHIDALCAGPNLRADLLWIGERRPAKKVPKPKLITSPAKGGVKAWREGHDVAALQRAYMISDDRDPCFSFA
jgi:hypothetical protein